MSIRWLETPRSFLYGIALVGLLICVLFPNLGFANGLGENTPYRFEHKDRLRMLEMQLLKESGFYDSQSAYGGGFGSGAGTTVINGDQINCVVQSSALANSNSAGMDAATGSLFGVSDGYVGADAGANDSEAWGSSDGGLDIGQENLGDQDARISDSNMNSDVGQFEGGGSTQQAVDTSQSADGSTLRSSIDDVTVCDSMTVN